MKVRLAASLRTFLARFYGIVLLIYVAGIVSTGFFHGPRFAITLAFEQALAWLVILVCALGWSAFSKKYKDEELYITGIPLVVSGGMLYFVVLFLAAVCALFGWVTFPRAWVLYLGCALIAGLLSGFFAGWGLRRKA